MSLITLLQYLGPVAAIIGLFIAFKVTKKQGKSEGRAEAQEEQRIAVFEELERLREVDKDIDAETEKKLNTIQDELQQAANKTYTKKEVDEELKKLLGKANRLKIDLLKKN